MPTNPVTGSVWCAKYFLWHQNLSVPQAIGTLSVIELVCFLKTLISNELTRPSKVLPEDLSRFKADRLLVHGPAPFMGPTNDRSGAILEILVPLLHLPLHFQLLLIKYSCFLFTREPVIGSDQKNGKFIQIFFPASETFPKKKSTIKRFFRKRHEMLFSRAWRG